MRYPTPIEIANTIHLKRALRPGPFLVVEGKDDRLFWQSFVSIESCTIEVAQGKDNVCEVVGKLEDDGFSGVLGVIDSDFDRVQNTNKTGPNVVAHEFHDLETMLIRSSALDRVLVEFGSLEKIQALDERVLDSIIDCALPMGYLRLFSLRNQLGLKFNGITYSAWVDRISFEANEAALIREVLNNSQRHDLPVSWVEDGISELRQANLDPFEICCGDDLIAILSQGLRSKLGNNQPNQVSADILKKSLRLAFEGEELRTSVTGREILAWQDRVAGPRVLR